MKTAQASIVVWTCLTFTVFVSNVGASGQQCSQGAACQLGEFIYDDTYILDTEALCSLASYYPDGSDFLKLKDITSTSGWYGHEFTTPDRQGTYHTELCCSSKSGEICLDKSFTVVASGLTLPDVVKEILNYSNRNLAKIDTLALNTLGNKGQALGVSNEVVINKDEVKYKLADLVNQQVITATDSPKLTDKLDSTVESLDQLALDHQKATSEIGLMALKWDGLSAYEMTGMVDEVLATLTKDSNLKWLSESWEWPELAVIAANTNKAKTSLVTFRSVVSTAGAQAIAYAQLTSALKSLEASEALIGEMANTPTDLTVYGRYKLARERSTSLSEQRRRLEELLSQWNNLSPGHIQTQVDELSHQTLQLNQIKGVESVLASDAKNRTLGLIGLIDANQTYAAQDRSKSLVTTWLEEDPVVFKTLVVNSSPLSQQIIPVKYYLPPELEGKDILEHDPQLTIQHDTDKDQYYVIGEVTVPAGQAVGVVVKVEDVWQFGENSVHSLRRQVNSLSQSLEGTEAFVTGLTLKSDVDAALDKVLGYQTEGFSPETKIKAYRQSGLEMAQASDKLDQLQRLVAQAGSRSNVEKFIRSGQVVVVGGAVAVIAGIVLLAAYGYSVIAQSSPRRKRRWTVAPVGQFSPFSANLTPSDL